MLRCLPEGARPGMIRFISYVTHGYFGLTLCMQEDFVWTYGLGSCPAVLTFCYNLGIDPTPIYFRTYAARTEASTGYQAGLNWSTVFPSFAGDLTFPGAAVAMGIFGWLFSKVTSEAVVRQNPFAVCLACQLWIEIAFVSANNQLGQNRRAFVTTVGLLTMWVLSSVGSKATEARVGSITPIQR